MSIAPTSHSAAGHTHGHDHAPARASVSLLQRSAWQRLAVSSGIIALIWAGYFWALA